MACCTQHGRRTIQCDDSTHSLGDEAGIRTMVTVTVKRGAAILLVQIALCTVVLLPLVVQSLAIETLHLPDRHSQQSHRAPGLTAVSEMGPVTASSVVSVAALDALNMDLARNRVPAARPVEPPEYPPR